MRSLVSASICVALTLAGCGGAPSTDDSGATSEVSAASRTPDPCGAGGRQDLCGVHALPGAFVAASQGPYAALVLSDAKCSLKSEVSAYCFFGQLADGTRIDGEYAAFRGRIELVYKHHGEAVVARYHYHHDGDALALTLAGGEHAVETLASVPTFCMTADDCRDQDVAPVICSVKTSPHVVCADSACVTSCGVRIPVPPVASTTTDDDVR